MLQAEGPYRFPPSMGFTCITGRRVGESVEMGQDEVAALRAGWLGRRVRVDVVRHHSSPSSARRASLISEAHFVMRLANEMAFLKTSGLKSSGASPTIRRAAWINVGWPMRLLRSVTASRISSRVVKSGIVQRSFFYCRMHVTDGSGDTETYAMK